MSNGFFSDEVRDGFYLSEMMKRFWGAQMVVLREIEKICERHSIKYFADMGTLLGAVRHKGFIPWDDDLDISMLRDDWESFFKYAKDELPEGYIVFSAESNQEYGLALGRIVNGGTINTEKSHLEKFCGCPYVAGVDVFPLDQLYNDEKKEAHQHHSAQEEEQSLVISEILQNEYQHYQKRSDAVPCVHQSLRMWFSGRFGAELFVVRRYVHYLVVKFFWSSFTDFKSHIVPLFFIIY